MGGALILHPLRMLLLPKRLLLLLQPVLIIQAIIWVKGSLLLLLVRMQRVFRITAIQLSRAVHRVDFLVRAPHLASS